MEHCHTATNFTGTDLIDIHVDGCVQLTGKLKLLVNDHWRDGKSDDYRDAREVTSEVERERELQDGLSALKMTLLQPPDTVKPRYIERRYIELLLIFNCTHITSKITYIFNLLF